MTGTNRVEDCIRRDAFCATTPPQIKLTINTDAKGVHRETLVAKFGALALTYIPNRTGNKTTRAVASQSVHPDTVT